MRVRIVSPASNDGSVPAQGTKLFIMDGEKVGAQVSDIRALTVEYPPDGAVTAKIECYINPHTIDANPLLSLGSIKEAADHYGYDLVRREPEPAGTETVDCPVEYP